MIQQLLAVASLLYPSATPPFLIIQPDAIPEVVCFSSKGGAWAGSAFRVGPSLMLSVNHVTSNAACFIGSKRVKVLYASPDADFSELQGDPGPYVGIDCGGFVKGRKYLALGHARANAELTPVELTATGETDSNGQAILDGMLVVIPGQSGGPIIDEETGKAVGTVNRENFEMGLSWSVPLSATPVCKGRTA